MKALAALDWHQCPAYWVYNQRELTATPTAAFVFVVSQGSLALTKVTTRGWDVPGGHIEADETPEQAALRELEEETGLTVLSCSFLAGLHLEDNPAPYPSPSSLWFFTASLEEQPLLTPSLECEDAAWQPLTNIPILCANKSWLPLLPILRTLL